MKLLIDHVSSNANVTGVCLGQVWTFCKAEKADGCNLGLAMSPQKTSRALSFPGSLVGKNLTELASWVNEWEACKITVGMAAINCSLNAKPLPNAQPLGVGIKDSAALEQTVAEGGGIRIFTQAVVRYHLAKI